MNEPHDPLEAELAALRPHEPSPQLKDRIANRLASSRSDSSLSRRAHAASQRPASGWLWVAKRTTASLALVGGLAAVGLVAAIIWRHDSRQVATAEPAIERLQPPLATTFDESLPTLWNYRRALDRSPAELDALLDKHAVVATSTSPQPVQIHGFIRIDSELHAFPGEL